MFKCHKVREFPSPLGLTVRYYRRTLYGWWKGSRASYWTLTAVSNEQGSFTWVNARESWIMELGTEYEIPIWGSSAYSHAERLEGSRYSASFQFVGKHLKRTLFLAGDNELTAQILMPSGRVRKVQR